MNEKTIKEKLGFYDKNLFQYVDKETLQIVNQNFIKDKRGVYLVPSYHPTKAEIKNDKIHTEKVCKFAVCRGFFTVKNLHFVHREDYVNPSTRRQDCRMYYIVKLKGVKPKEFTQAQFIEKIARYVKSSYYLKDDKNAYYYNSFHGEYIVKLKKANVAHFVALNDSFAKDDKYCYFMDKIIAGADAATFKRKGDKTNPYLDIYTYEDKKFIYINDNNCRVHVQKKKKFVTQ
ncbi:hypothetical protein A3J90_00655 [candidate division WOR-1 bacterium RIFOXYC2_FULL_37_10]|uniref:Uncharacterized protein n=1 Tax=candidate division WOR-1 bacterium RIFOXYB2_FULL_37_13 TaxID=1802579 RepID=A0A1F4SKW2_UNCSA|nr:MAG: hypothetical protein A2310_08190 [candidate division WOR-1 bacterium RIFOXYB2_FULL_37_13]OGC36695.1 MAG: hypothetical protein A3J90_00655 [candidate division WOR-1 bacterium RIFOXYC2_FULL_37_10]